MIRQHIGERDVWFDAKERVRTSLGEGKDMNSSANTPLAPVSLDDNDRITDFLSRHGGAGSTPPRRGESTGGLAGWSEIFAADGHVLRCDWTRQGTRSEMSYEELPPAAES
jgi:hypothetical protein